MTLAQGVPAPAPTGPPHVMTGHAVEFVLAALFFLLGVRSAVHWLRVGFRPDSARDAALFALHATGRVGTWFALAGAFVLYATAAEPRRYAWYFALIPGLAGVQLLSGFFLSREPTPDPPSPPQG